MEDTFNKTIHITESVGFQVHWHAQFLGQVFSHWATQPLVGHGSNCCMFLPSIRTNRGLNNQVLLYSTGNYIQYPVINHNGKKYEKEINYISINLKKKRRKRGLKCPFVICFHCLDLNFLFSYNFVHKEWTVCNQN